jgi:multidrug efflux pump subunit AcrB
MFAFIIALGIVVDDAIISGENIYHYREKGLSPIAAAVTGAQEISLPIFVSILTNIAAFVPLLFVPGYMGKIFSVIPVVVITIFIISLIESLFILPAHLAFKKSGEAKKDSFTHHIREKQKAFNRRFSTFINEHYKPFLNDTVIRFRYLSLSIFIAILLIAGGYSFSGRLGLTLFPTIESDYAFASATLNVGAPYERTQAVSNQLLAAAQEVIKENGGEALSQGIRSHINENIVEMRVYLTDPDVRPISTATFSTQWRNKVGDIPSLETLSIISNRGGPGSGAELTIELSHSDTTVLDAAAIQLADALAQFPNTEDIDDGSAQGKKQYDFKMKPLGFTLGMTTADVARQVRASFYGSEVFKQQRDRNEVRVLVRLPEEQRASQYYLKNLMLRAPNGSDVLLRDVVSMREGHAYTTIHHRDGHRVISVRANVDPPSKSNAIISAIKENTLPLLVQQHPALVFSFEGKQANIRESLDSLFLGLGGVLFIIYVLLAILFASYSQPFMVLVAIPFGTVGAIAGHFLMGYTLSIMSLFGIMALTGVVINDSLILVEFANRKRRAGIKTMQAIVDAAVQRFRPIILTTLTTFLGLAPIMFETSRQARFLIPMALSLGFGILFATLLTLVLIPALYMIIEDLKSLFKSSTQYD